MKKLSIAVIMVLLFSCGGDKQQESVALVANLPFTLIGSEKSVELTYLGQEVGVMDYSYEFQSAGNEKVVFRSDLYEYNTARPIQYNEKLTAVYRNETIMDGMMDLSGDWIIYIEDESGNVVFATKDVIERANMDSGEGEIVQKKLQQLNELSNNN
tara:strand:- start:5143 stop:5610 length:468 start_codon:yes stop_codon:yes gene_type:complete